MSVPPWLVLAAVVSLCLALVYQLASRRYGWRALGYWAVVLVAMLGSEAAAESIGWNVTRLGDLRVAPDLAGGVAILAILWYLGI